ncbi:MAG TPA: alpha/beta fold hydrolase [Steroidobacteraceae bacterium]|nr:alpha/beta fold hydrolase [Steroidobacteraceae bacterium]
MTARRKKKTNTRKNKNKKSKMKRPGTAQAAPAPDSASAPAASASASVKAHIVRDLRAQLAALTGGMAPDDYLKAWWEWYLNLATHPPRQAQLAHSAYEKLLDSWQFLSRAAGGESLPPGHENLGFGDAAWNVWPFNVYARTYANWASWWHQALSPPAAANDPNLARVNFAGRMLLESASPANFLHTNPELLKRTAAESGHNLIRGLKHWLEDARRAVSGNGHAPGAEHFQVGRDVAITPGKVVFRNRLIELLQYSPQTPTVYAEPVLITPAWIMKYYILDLSPRNSLVRYLVEKGHTVFMISWKNPDAADRELRVADYVKLGFLDALAEVRRIVPRQRVHAVGYCIGGTLLAIAAALLAAERDSSLASLTLLAAQVDFSEPGELSVFITPSQIAMLEAMMSKSGVLESERMGAAFAMLRSRDLMWNPAVNQYVRGERPQLNDLMAWNADGTRMPWRMHSEYLERLYLKNELAEGSFTLNGARVDLSRIQLPMFVVGTETDHVAPWRSAYKIRGLTRSADYTFLLTSGGHNAGIVSGPVHPKRRHRLLSWKNANATATPDEWLEKAPLHEGSWWPAWERWLANHSAARQIPARMPATGGSDGATSADAPGTYVRS